VAAVNISESNDTNRLLRLLLRALAVDALVPDELDQAAAIRLADRASKTLHAGLTGTAVAAAWPTGDAK
jgi:hypothetical protein